MAVTAVLVCDRKQEHDVVWLRGFIRSVRAKRTEALAVLGLLDSRLTKAASNGSLKACRTLWQPFTITVGLWKDECMQVCSVTLLAVCISINVYVSSRQHLKTQIQGCFQIDHIACSLSCYSTHFSSACVK